MSRTSALGWVARMVLISGSSTGLTPPPRCAPSRARRRRTAAADEEPAGTAAPGRAGCAARAGDLPARFEALDPRSGAWCPGLRRGPQPAGPGPAGEASSAARQVGRVRLRVAWPGRPGCRACRSLPDSLPGSAGSAGGDRWPWRPGSCGAAPAGRRLRARLAVGGLLGGRVLRRARADRPWPPAPVRGRCLGCVRPRPCRSLLRHPPLCSSCPPGLSLSADVCARGRCSRPLQRYHGS